MNVSESYTTTLISVHGYVLEWVRADLDCEVGKR